MTVFQEVIYYTQLQMCNLWIITPLLRCPIKNQFCLHNLYLQIKINSVFNALNSTFMIYIVINLTLNSTFMIYIVINLALNSTFLI